MDDINAILATVMPSATPTEAEIHAWNQLPREEQIRRLRLSLTSPESSRVSEDTMADLLAEARRRADARNG